MSAWLVAQVLLFLPLAMGAVIPGGPVNVVPEFTDLTQIFGDVCGLPLGVEIENDQFTATSSQPGHEPHMARFNKGLAGWMPTENDVGQWIEVRLPSTIYVTAILTQGSPIHPFYVTEYRVEYRKDSHHNSCVLDMHGQPKIFEGNVDNSTPKINDFRPAVSSNYIRILPVKWEIAIALRLEIFGGGCEECWQK